LSRAAGLLLASGLFAAGLAADFRSLLDEGERRYASGEWEEARLSLEKAIGLGPKSFEARFLLGATLVQLNRSADAVRELRAACQLNPRHKDAAKLLAIELGKNDNSPEAVKLLAPMVDDTPFDEEIHLLLIEAYQAAGDAEPARELATKTLGRFPRSAGANYWMGLELRDAGRFPEAREFLGKALKLDPDFELVYVALGDVELKEQKYDDAARYFRAVLAKQAESAEALIGLSRALVGLDQLSSAIETLEHATLRTAEPRIHLELSRLYSRRGDRDRAAREAELFRKGK
jgi:tetratricopeptide (TPR) repeat protein